eukprot:6460306-Amphidinium_carterae.1
MSLQSMWLHQGLPIHRTHMWPVELIVFLAAHSYLPHPFCLQPATTCYPLVLAYGVEEVLYQKGGVVRAAKSKESLSKLRVNATKVTLVCADKPLSAHYRLRDQAMPVPLPQGGI